MIMKLKTNKPVIFSVLIAAITIGGMLVLGLGISLVLGDMFMGETDYYFFLFISELVAAIFVIAIASVSGNLYTLRRKGAGLLRGFVIGAFPTIMLSYLAGTMFLMGYMTGGVVLPTINLLAYFGSMFLIGFVEELAFRGVIAEVVIDRFGTSPIGVWKATLVSGVIFGVAHISNALEAELFGVLVQVAVASVLGMLLTAIYYRSGNLWVCIFIHGGLDAASLLMSGVFGEGTLVDMVSSFSFINLTPCITYSIPVLVLLRKAKNYEVQQWFGTGERA